jgi:transposase-like protein
MVSLGFREVEEMMLRRGIVVSHEMIRQWWRTLGQANAIEPWVPVPQSSRRRVRVCCG